MATKKFRVWHADEDDNREEMLCDTLASAIKSVRKLGSNYDESNSGLEVLVDGEWDEWLDDDAQNIHDHLYMHNGKSPLMKERSRADDAEAELVEEDTEDDEDFDEEEEEEEETFEDDEDQEERLLSVIGGAGADDDEEGEADEDEEDVNEEADFDEDDDVTTAGDEDDEEEVDEDEE